MKVEIATICDAATEQNGKLNILGAFDSLMASELPLQHPHCACAFRVRYNRVEAGEHTVSLKFMNEDGQGIVPALEGKFFVKVPQETGTSVNNLILNIQGLRFEQAGLYSIDMAIDGKHQLSLPLRVNWIAPRAKEES